MENYDDFSIRDSQNRRNKSGSIENPSRNALIRTKHDFDQEDNTKEMGTMRIRVVHVPSQLSIFDKGFKRWDGIYIVACIARQLCISIKNLPINTSVIHRA